MIVKFSPSALKDGRWYEYLIRFVLGGAVTAFTGVISSLLGVSIGGLFLALPAIFCASATLIESHAKRRKQEAGLRRGQQAAALDAAGAALGSLGMLAFALTFWLLVEREAIMAFVAALAVWTVISVAAWWTWRHLRAASRVSGPRGPEFAARELT